MKKIMVGLMVISLFLVACSQPAADDGKIKIGFMGPLTGDAASYGTSILNGVQLAIEDMGLENVELVTEDSKCDGKEAVTAINKLISVDNVQAIVGEVCSGATLAALPIANSNSVPMVSPSSTSPKISESGEYAFRTVPSDALQGSFGADLVHQNGYEKLAVLYSNEEYGLGFNNVLKDSFAGEVVASEAFERGSVDIRTQLTKIKESGADSIYIISNSPDSAVAALQQITELSMTQRVFGSEGLKSQDITGGAGAAAEGLILTTVSGGSEEFLTRHQEKYGEEPGPFAAQGYDAFSAIALTLQQGATTGEEIRTLLLENQFEGASGTIAFDENGDVAGNYDVYIVTEGDFVLQ